MLIEPADRGWFTFTGAFAPEVPAEFSMRITGTVVASETGEWTFGLQAGAGRAAIDATSWSNWQPSGRSDAFMGFGSSEVTATIELVAGEPHRLEVDFVPAGPSLGGLAIGCTPPVPADLIDAWSRWRRAPTWWCAWSVPTAIGRRRQRPRPMTLPSPQDELVQAVAEVNGRTIVAVNVASPVEMNWADDVGADPPVLVRRRAVGKRARRRAVGRRLAVGQAANHVSGSHRGHARFKTTR